MLENGKDNIKDILEITQYYAPTKKSSPLGLFASAKEWLGKPVDGLVQLLKINRGENYWDKMYGLISAFFCSIGIRNRKAS